MKVNLECPVPDIGCADPVNGARIMELSGLDGLEVLRPALCQPYAEGPWTSHSNWLHVAGRTYSPASLSCTFTSLGVPTASLSYLNFSQTSS